MSISPQELEAIEASANAAFAKLVFHGMWYDDFDSDEKFNDFWLLHTVKFQSPKDRDLSVGNFPESIIKAAKRNDKKFFRKLGRILERCPPPQHLRSRSKGELARILCLHWAKELNGIPPFYALRPDDLVELCSEYLNGTPVTLDMVIKARRWLGLKIVKHGKLDLQRRSGKLILGEAVRALRRL